MRRLILALAVVVLILGAAVGLLASHIWTRIHTPFQGYSGPEQVVDIPSGTTPSAIGARLFAARVIDDSTFFRAALWWTGQSRALKAGEYLFDRPMTTLEVIDKIARGEVYAHRITFPEGLTIPDLAAIFESRGVGTARDFEVAARDTALIADLDPVAPDLEGYLFPETYAVPRATSGAEMVGLMVERFRAVYSEDLRRTAAAQKLTTREVLTLASLVEKETARPDERPLVAAVYRNRVRIKMGLQADPTVVYALRKAGKYDGNIRRADLLFNSPYNTYRYAGLPPGPIAAPGQASIEAVLAPADVKYLYFVSRNDGSHVFAETLREHNRNVQEFQVRYFQQQRRQTRQGVTR